MDNNAFMMGNVFLAAVNNTNTKTDKSVQYERP